MKIEVVNNITTSSNGEATKIETNVFKTTADGRRELIEKLSEDVYRDGKEGKLFKAFADVGSNNR